MTNFTKQLIKFIAEKSVTDANALKALIKSVGEIEAIRQVHPFKKAPSSCATFEDLVLCRMGLGKLLK